MTAEATWTMALVIVTVAGLNLGMLKWFFSRHENAIAGQIAALKHEGSDYARHLGVELLQLKAILPVDYVRRDELKPLETLRDQLQLMGANVRAMAEEIDGLRALQVRSERTLGLIQQHLMEGE